MSTYNAHFALLGLLLWGIGAPAAAETPRLGEPLSAESVDEIDYVVLPDGTGLPPGAGTARQGADVYREHCLACHGERGEGSVNDVLAGGRGSIDSGEPVKTVGSYWPYATTVFDYIRRAMPYQQPAVLSDDQVYAVTAYLLHVNGIVGLDDVIDDDSLPRVEMPNHGNFVWAYTPRLRAEDDTAAQN